MQRIREELARVAASDATVLISGESGTGKELIARALHAASARRDRPMLCLNCAALAGNLMESELFGHERGAFTGADRLRKGRFELADGGTLMLDEISEMAMPLQAKFLRVLQESEFERVGSSITRRADVRVLATTNRNLSDWVSRKRFRADLYYRLNVLPIILPPLRERREDIPELVTGFFDRIARRRGTTRDEADNNGSTPRTTEGAVRTAGSLARLRFAPDAMELLTAYDWPGNVRELENLCERAAAMRSNAGGRRATPDPADSPRE
jgi:transcriptional regulator with GAF, ATPase, and Fis domain